MKEHILVAQKGNADGEVADKLRTFLGDDAFPQKALFHLKACCCQNKSRDETSSVKKSRSTSLKQETVPRQKNVAALCKAIVSCDCNSSPEEKPSFDKWIEDIHLYADYIPKFGCQKKVFWIVSEGELQKPEDDLGFLGAMKRLVEWHGVQIYILCPTTVTKEKIFKEWVDLLYARVLNVANIAEILRGEVWAGSVHLAGSQGSTLHLPGFCLSSSKHLWSNSGVSLSGTSDVEAWQKDLQEMFATKILDEKMELVAPVATSEVPSFALTSYIFTLCIPSESRYLEKSRKFLRQLQEDPNLGYILRLDTGTSCKERNPRETYDKREDKATEGETDNDEEESEWIKRVSSNISNIFDGPHREEMELAGETGFYQFLVYQGLRGDVLVQLMRDTSQIRPSIVKDLHQAETLRQKEIVEAEESNALQNLLQRLPHFAGSSFVEMQDDLDKFQASVLQQWIHERKTKEESTILPWDVLTSILCQARKKFMELCEDQYYSDRPIGSRCVIVEPRPAYLEDPYSQLERLALLLREAQEERAFNGPLGLSPPKAKVLTLDARQFLKLFKKDGTAAKEPAAASVQKSPKRRFCKYDSGINCEDKWPDCKYHRFHGINYLLDDKSTEMEALCEKMKERLLNMETASTCTLKQTHSTITVQKEGRKLRHKHKKEAPSSNDENKPKSCVKTPKAKKKANVSLLEKRKRILQQARNNKAQSSTPLKLSPGKVSWTPKKSHPATLQLKGKTPRKSPRKALSTKSTPRKSVSTPHKAAKSPALKKGKEYTLEAKIARAKRHAKLLEKTLTNVLHKHGVPASDQNFKACFQKLYTITKCFLKDLKNVTSLRVEMESIAEDNVQNVLKRVLKS